MLPNELAMSSWVTILRLGVYSGAGAVLIGRYADQIVGFLGKYTVSIVSKETLYEIC